MIGYSFTASPNPKSMHQVFALGWHSTASQVKCTILLFWQCDFTQLWGNQPTKIGRKALCIRIKINKFKTQYIQVSQTSNSKFISLFFFPSRFQKLKKKRKRKEKKHKQARKVTLKSKDVADNFKSKPPSAWSELKQLHSPTRFQWRFMTPELRQPRRGGSFRMQFRWPKRSPTTALVCRPQNKNKNPHFILTLGF